MSTVKVSDLSQITTLANTDLLLVSQDQGGSVFTSKAVPYPALIGSSKIENNFFDNPDFSVSQFFGSNPSVPIYSAMASDNGHPIDRWRASTPGSGTWTVTRVTSDAPISSVSKYTLRISNTTANNTITLTQRWSSDQVRPIRTGPCAISFWVKPPVGVTSVIINFKVPTADTNFSSTFTRNESGSGKTVTGLTANAWNLVTYTFDPSLWTTDGNSSSIIYGLQFYLVLATVASYWGVADFQFNRGTVANTFVNPSISSNEARCGFFMAKTFTKNTAVAQNAGFTGAILYRCVLTTASGHSANWRFPYPMRSIPNVTCYSPDNASSDWSPGGGGYITSTIGYISEYGVTVTSGANVTSVGTGYYLHMMAECRL